MCEVPPDQIIQSKTSTTDAPRFPSFNTTAAAAAQKEIPFDPAYYTWSNYFRGMLGINSDDEVKLYLHMRSLAKQEQDCKQCERWRDWLLSNSPVVRFLRESVEKLHGTEAPPDPTIASLLPKWKSRGSDDTQKEEAKPLSYFGPHNILCKTCDTLGDGLLHKAGYNKHLGILLCANHIKSYKEMEDVLAHEMVHAYDYARFKFDSLNLKHSACSEIRAAMLSGECRWANEFWVKKQFKFAMHFQDCVRKRAVLSVAGRPNCPDDLTAVRAVNEVWESCFSDTRPFDEIYR